MILTNNETPNGLAPETEKPFTIDVFKLRLREISEVGLNLTERNQRIFRLFVDYFCPNIDREQAEKIISICPCWKMGEEVHHPCLMVQAQDKDIQSKLRKEISRAGLNEIFQIDQKSNTLKFIQGQAEISLDYLTRFDLKLSHGMCPSCADSVAKSQGLSEL